MDDIYNNIGDYNPKRNRKILIVFGGMIADVNPNKKFQAIELFQVKELFFRSRKLNISLAFITQSYFLVPKEVRLNSMHYLIMKIHNKRQLQYIAINHSAAIGYKDFMNNYRYRASKPNSFLTIDPTLPADDHLPVRKNPLDSL